MVCLSRSSYTKRKALNRLHLVYKRSISLTNLASGVQNWRFVYKYALFDLQTGISPYKLAPRITTQQYLGRKLKHGEEIHHIDGNKLNNSIENLQLLTTAEHRKLHVDPKTGKHVPYVQEIKKGSEKA